MSGYRFEIYNGTDTIHVEITEDGTIKTETDTVSAANHSTADTFLKEMFRLAGGKSEVRFKRPVAVTENAHVHSHKH